MQAFWTGLKWGVGHSLGLGLVEEKFEKSFGYLARCEGKVCTTTLKNLTNHAKIVQNANKMPSKFQNRLLKTLFEI